MLSVKNMYFMLNVITLSVILMSAPVPSLDILRAFLPIIKPKQIGH